MQHFFKESSGAIFHPSVLQASSTKSLMASAITWQKSEDGNKYLKIKVSFHKIHITCVFFVCHFHSGKLIVDLVSGSFLLCQLLNFLSCIPPFK